MELNQEQIDAAAQQESAESGNSVEILKAQNLHLSNRVVILRAAVNELGKEHESALAKIEELEQKLKKKTTAKKTTSRSTT